MTRNPVGPGWGSDEAAGTQQRPTDFERLVLRILEDLTESLRSVQSMALGGGYEDTRLWSVEHDLKQLTTLIDGRDAAPDDSEAWIAGSEWSVGTFNQVHGRRRHNDGPEDGA